MEKTGKTNLKFLTLYRDQILFNKGLVGLGYRTMKKLAELIKQGKTIQEIATETTNSVGYLHILFRELCMASRKYRTLEDYYAGGRIYKGGKSPAFEPSNKPIHVLTEEAREKYRKAGRLGGLALKKKYEKLRKEKEKNAKKEA